jgi:hypothetical protein
MSSWLRRAGLGRLAYRLWHAPRGMIVASLRAGGPIEQWRTERGRRAMEKAAFVLPRLPAQAGAPLAVHVLTGRRFWYQTAFCLWSFSRQAGRSVAPVFYDDGTLAGGPRDGLARLFPRAIFVPQEQTLSRLDQILPASRYPFLRDRWRQYPNIRKLIDPHLGSTGWKLVLDSDLLFFHCPKFIVDWLETADRPCHAVDVEKSYGYSDPLLESLARGPLHPRLNVGLCGLDSGSLDWDWLENCCRALIEAEGTSYYLEQALVAVLLAGQVCAIAPAEDYITLPGLPEVVACQAVMHHYVAGSKRWYFRDNWRRTLQP